MPHAVPVIAFVRPDGKRVVIAANLTDRQNKTSIKLGKKYMNLTLAPHSFHTMVER